MSATAQSTSDKYKNEEVKSNRIYPVDFKAKSIGEQCECLSTHLGWRGNTTSAQARVVRKSFPKLAEDCFAIPCWQSLARTYGEAVAMVVEAIKRTRTDGFHDCCNQHFDACYLCRTPEIIDYFNQLMDQQENQKLLLIPAQFGLRHRGRSSRRALEVMESTEHGLDVFSVAVMILTHPKRFSSDADLCVSCPGNRYSLLGNRSGLDVPVFGWNNGNLWLSASLFVLADERFGSASCFDFGLEW